ncbi:MAG: HD domain-containing protein [Candidatus Eremiobacteraeota bacterium]|nr:HD domain-containing protein [Candidatus Eremiobacteraeota bacterium]
MSAQLLIAAVLLAAAAPAQTATGISLDAPWKVTIYDLARTKFHHPAWGWQHSERNYRIALELAQGDGLHVDTDVLFAAAFLHDIAAFMPCPDAKLEHGECAARQSGKILQAAGFPMEKLAAVQAAERGHMYYSDPGTQPEAIVLHDADSLDFLGEIGAARMLSLAGESAESFAKAVKTLRSFVHEIPPRLITKTAQRMGAERAAALARFLDALEAETFGGQAM